MSIIIAGNQKWTVEEVEGRTYYSVTQGRVTYSVCYHANAGRWLAMAGQRFMFADTLEEMAGKRKALRSLPMVVEITAEDMAGEGVAA